MKNLTLKRGDTIKALRDVDTPQGTLTRGATYLVESIGVNTLCVNTPQGPIVLVDSNGDLTDACLDVRLFHSPKGTALPQGQCPIVSIAK